MTARRLLLGGVVVLALTVTLVAPFPRPTAGADLVDSLTVLDFTYRNRISNPSADKPQSKLWYAHGSWWGLLVNPGDSLVHIYRLDDAAHQWENTGVVVDDRIGSTGDALWDGERLYIASRHPESPLRVSRFSFDPTADTWSLDAGFPVSVGHGGSESATIAKDSLGNLWVTYTREGGVWVAHSVGGDATWSAAFPPAVPDTSVTEDDISAVVSFDDNIGVMWSDQDSHAFRFAVHRDGASDTEWTMETPLAGFGMADDHLNLISIPSTGGTRVVAAVKTSLDEVNAVPDTAAQVAVLERSPTGRWSSVPGASMTAGFTRPILVVDRTSRELYLIAESGGLGLFYKRSPLDDLTFFSGRGEPLSGDDAAIGDATTTKQPITAATDLVVLGSTDKSNEYYHVEADVPRRIAGVSADDTSPPTGIVAPLTQVTQGCQVQLAWVPATDDSQVLGYAVRRNGVVVARTPNASYTDTSTSCGNTYRYSLAAYDTASNRSHWSEAATARTPQPARGERISLRGVTANANTGGARIVLPAPTSRPGDLLLASVDVRNLARVQTPAGWELLRATTSGSLTKLTYTRQATRTEGSSYSWRFDVSSPSVGTVLAYTGVSNDAPTGQVRSQGDDSTNIALPSLPALSPDSLVVGLFSVAKNATITQPPEMVERIEQSYVAPRSIRVAATATDMPAGLDAGGQLVASASVGGANVGQLVVLRPERSSKTNR